MISLVAGGAGFIGANLVERLLAEGARVIAADNFTRGSPDHLRRFESNGRFSFVPADLSRPEGCAAMFAAAPGPVDEVWHLAANSDIPAGVADPGIDLRDTFMTTFELLKAMRAHGARRLLFASSSAVYGDHGDVELTEASGPLFPISNYGAMKLASEAQIAAAAEAFLDQALIFRFPNVVGVPATHGVIVDLIRKLKADPAVLPVLGDGSQRKPYLHVAELIDAMMFLRARASSGVAAFNIGPLDAGASVRWIAEQVAARVSPSARLEFGQGDKGWVGDVSRFRYSTAKLQALGWSPALGSEAALRRAIDEIARQEGC